MFRFVAVVSLCIASGCTLSVISGFEDGGTSSSSGGSTGAGSLTSGGTTGQLAATGSGTASGGGQGSTGQGFSSTGGSTGRSIGSSGGSSTGYSGDAGPCMAFGSNCINDAQCCNGACNGTCGQAFGQSCLGDPDCSSRNCTNGQCACSTSQADQTWDCASDQDCCGGVGCQHYFSGAEYGLCCNATGASCPIGNECCNQNCVDGQCECQPTGTACGYYFDDCCSGICTNVVAEPGSDYKCQSGPGGQCTGPTDCTTRDCDGGVCGGCALSQGTCSSTSDCCSGLTCASSLTGSGISDAGPAVDGGTLCCGQPGTSCDASDGVGPEFGCCGTCNNGTCACVTATNTCTTDQSCCAGGACMTRVAGGSSELACCQVSGQFCLSDPECCSGSCGKDQKCAD